MSLRRRTVIILAGLSLLYGLAGIAVLRFLVLPEFVQLEQSSAYQEMARLEDMLQQELASIQRSTRDYAEWDMCYDFVGGGYPAFAAEQLPPEIYDNLNIDYVCVTDLDDRILHQAFRPRDPKLLDKREAAVEPAVLASELVGQRPGSSGYILTRIGLLQLARAEVRHSDHSGPVAGYIYMGRLHGPAFWADLSARNHIKLQVHDMNTVRRDPQLLSLLAQLQGESSGSMLFTRPGRLEVCRQLLDTRGGTAALVCLTHSREISAAGLKTILWAGGLCALLGLFFLVTVLSLLDRSVLGPLARLSRSARSIARVPQAGARLPVQGRDELAAFSESLNTMLNSLEEAEREGSEKLREAEVRAVRMTAATYAHEINNPLAGILGYLQLMRDGALEPTEVDAALEEMLSAAGRISSVLHKIEGLHNPRLRASLGREQLLELAEGYSAAGTGSGVPGHGTASADHSSGSAAAGGMGRSAAAP